MQSLLALAVATAILVSIPGPNVALIVANSLHFGVRSGFMSVFGTTLGVAAQLTLVVIGMAAIIDVAATALTWVKWAGVLYLLWLGFRTWREPVSDLAAAEASPTVFWSACLIAAVNPKTLLFNAAFVPQFIPDGADTSQVLLVAGVFLMVLFVGDLLWAVFAVSARSVFRRSSTHRNRFAGAFLVAAAAALAWSRSDRI